MLELLTACLLALAQAASDSYISVQASVATPKQRVDRAVHFTLTAIAPQEQGLELPNLREGAGGLKCFKEPLTEKEGLEDGRIRIRQTYEFLAKEPGDYVIGALKASWNGAEPVTVPAVAVSLRALTPEEEEAAKAFAPIVDAIGGSRGLPPSIKGLLAAALITFAVVAALGYFLIRRTKPAAASAAPPPSAWEVAYARLRELEGENLPAQGQWETFYVRLSDIARHYIEDRFTLHAPEQTTPEFLAAAALSGVLTDAHQSTLAAFLRHSDMVKFARYEPALTDMERSYFQVRDFIDDTVPRRPLAPSKEQAA